MTAQNIMLPLARVSPVLIPRRDLTLGGADSLALSVTIIEEDAPDAAPIALTGGIGGPVLSMLLWPDCPPRGSWGSWDYGSGLGCCGASPPVPPLWQGQGVINPAMAGTWTIGFQTATMASWPRRLVYQIALDWNGSGDTELLSSGRLHLTPSVARPSPDPVAMLVDSSLPTSSAGLPPGSYWNNGGFLCVV